MDAKRRKGCPILCIIAICSISHVQANWGWGAGSYPLRSDMACEENDITLRCPGNDVIQIVTAEYGRQSTETCSARASQMKNTNCALPEALDILSSQCNNMTMCSLTVSSKIFPDPCPGTHKYLSTMYNCVKYMFGCPGFLVGIGTEDVADVEMLPQAGTWVKDPLHNTDRVFFAPFKTRQAQIVHEYSDWANFISGNPIMSYNLPSDISDGNMVVYDRNLFYVRINEENAKSVVKYNLITRYRVKETEITKRRSSGGSHITLAADEHGLWVIYTEQNNDVMVISELNKDELSIKNTWTTTYNPRGALHTFVICGVVYVVGSSSGKVEYYYNTNVKNNQEKRRPNIAFDADHTIGFEYPGSRRSSSRGGRPTGRSFLRYNTSSISYNPRDRLLYVWDQNTAKAVVYKLHFDARDPTKADVITTSPPPTTTTTTTTRRTTVSTTKRPVRPEYPPLDEDGDGPKMSPYYCQAQIRGNINWPKTEAGVSATMPCPDSTGAVATWRCVRDSSMREADWHVAGPDLSRCITWASEIEQNLDTGLIDPAEASERLAQNMEGEALSVKAIEVTSQLVKKLVDATKLPSKFDAEKIVKSLATVSSNLLDEENAVAWESMDNEKRAVVANTLMSAVEQAGFIYAQTVAATRAEDRDKEPLVVAPEGMIMQVEVRDRVTSGSGQFRTSFPSEKTVAENPSWSGVSDVIEIPDFAIMSQKGEGPATVVFVLYNNLGDFLATPPPPPNKPVPAELKDEDVPRDLWEIDSRVISASFRSASYQAELSSPAVIHLKHKKESSHPHRCVYWDYSESSRTGNWSDSGCRKIGGNSTHTNCECDHLTSFAVLVNHAGVSAEEIYHEAALDIVTSVGISISIVCLLICIVTFSCFRNLYSDRNTIHKHLCICLLVAEAIFLIGINQTQQPVACAVIAGLLHYSFLAAFLWMALEGFQLYVMLVEVFEGHSRWKWYYLTGYGIPAVIVGVSAGVDYTGYGTDDVCWLRVDSGFIWSFVGPVCVVILVNLVFLSITVYKMYVHTMTFSDSAKINSIKAAVRGASVLLCLLGITWAFGILWISEHMTVLAYLFCIFNAFQGMFIFVFHCLLPKKVRHEYSRCFSRLPCCETVARDTYVSNSMTFSKQYTPGRYANGANGGTQQASLSRQSQLRRMWNETVAPKNPDAPISSEVTSLAQNRDGRPGNCAHRVTSQAQGNLANDQHIHGPQDQNLPPILPARQQQLRQEDDVFLPAEPVPEPRPTQMSRSEPENVALLQSEQLDDIQYDHLQHHHHHDHFHHPPQFEPDRYPPEHYLPNGGKLPPASRQHFSSTVAHPHSHSHPLHFNSVSYSQSRMQDIMNDPCMDHRQRFESGHMTTPYWSDSPVGHHYQSSYEDSGSNAKRDSGISMQHPPNHIASDVQKNKNRRSHDNDGMQADSDGSNRIVPVPARRFSNPPRGQGPCDDIHIHPHHRVQRHEDLAASDDQEMYDGRENNRMSKKSNTMAGRVGPHCPNHPMLVPLSERQNKAITMGNRRRKSLSSDSDDPIVTDCSVSSTGSSFGNPLASLSRIHNAQNNISEEPYYDEKPHHKRRLPNPAQSVKNHREPWYPNKVDTRQRNDEENGDENDLEVEMITAPEGVAENPRIPSSVASYHHGSASPHSTTNQSPDIGQHGGSQREDRYISPPAGYRSGAGGKHYAPPGSTVDKYRQSNREQPPHMGYHSRNIGHPNTDNRNSPSCQEYGPGYRYLPNNISREGSAAGSRSDDLDSNGGLRMMTNL